jgi:hypothetical protein
MLSATTNDQVIRYALFQKCIKRILCTFFIIHMPFFTKCNVCATAVSLKVAVNATAGRLSLAYLASMAYLASICNATLWGEIQLHGA